jgi:hypothetical protein
MPPLCNRRDSSSVKVQKSRSLNIGLIFCATLFCLVAAMLILTRIGRADAQDVAVDPVIGDTNSDIVTANFGSDNVTVLAGNADGTFGNAVSFVVSSKPRVRDPFPVVSGTHLLLGPDLNTRVLIFVSNLQLLAGETPAGEPGNATQRSFQPINFPPSGCLSSRHLQH